MLQMVLTACCRIPLLKCIAELEKSTCGDVGRVAHYLFKHLVHKRTRVLVIAPQCLQHLQDFDLSPRRWNAVVVVLLGILVIEDVRQDLHQFLGNVFVLVRVLDDCIEDHVESGKHHWSFMIAECLERKRLDVGQVIPEESVDVEESEVALAADDGGGVLEEFAEEWQQVLHEVFGEKVAEQGESGHNGEGVLILEVLDDGVVHEQAQLISGLDEQRGQEVGHFFEVEIGRLAEVDGQDVCEGGVVAECFEVDEFDEDVGVLFGVAGLGELELDVLDLSINYLFLG